MSEITEKLKAAVADRYVIEREVGAGGMATVYLAHDVRHDRRVALKVLRPELAAVIGADRFLQEIKVTANLQHPHILALHDSGEVEGSVYYVMPFVDGESLRERLARERQLPVADAVRIASEVADALHYAHGLGVVHRDIKPENILLQGGHALVADFGIALAVSRSEGGTRMTETGMSLGTPHYMSPEQAMGEREISGKADVYALGCVLYEMLSGEPPFTGPTAQAIIARVMTEEPRSLTLQRRTVPPHVEAAVDTALAKLPADRFATAQEFGRALADPDSAPATRRATAAAAPSAARRAARLGAGWGWVAVTGAAVLLGGWGWVRAWTAPEPPTTWQYVSLGESLDVHGQAPALAISPQGDHLVFRYARANSLLWLKRRGELDPTPIPGTERAFNPVFSPDGEWVAFVADGRVKKVRPSGGATVTLADSAAGGYGGVAWLDNGRVVYVNPTLNRLRSVSAAGGGDSVLLQDSALVGAGIGHPVALPESRGVLFQACSSGCVEMAIHVLDLRTGRQRPLLEDVAQAWYLPGGHLLYVRRDGVALAAPFDLETLEVTGEAVPVLENVAVRSDNGFARLVWSASGSVVYARAQAGSGEYGIVRVDRTGDVSAVDTTWRGPFNSLDLSPDGGRLAVGMGAGIGLNIWVKTLDRGPFTRLTFGNRDRRPAWSPDGRVVAFVRDSANTSGVYARRVDGSGPDMLLARIDRLVQEVTWLPDGNAVIVRTDNGAAGAGDLVRVEVRDGDGEPLVDSQFSELHPAVSPDGRWLAYTSNESGINEVYVRPLPDTRAARWQVSNGGGSHALWSRDGRELFFLDDALAVKVARIRGGSTFAVETVRPLFEGTRFIHDDFHQSYAVTPDGGQFFFITSGETPDGNANAALVWVDHWFRDLDRRLRE